MVATTPKFCGIHPRIELKPGKTCFQCIENEAEHGNDKDVVTFVFYSHPDKWGNVSFATWWWSETYHLGPRWCGQMFRCDPTEQVNRVKAGPGKKYREILKIGR